jgi:5-methyltetrahydropteroyltriglutamate--homocysteine methyltransferase
VRAAVEETVRRQREAGIDIVNDGEVSKPSYATYVTERLTGFEGEPTAVRPRGRAVKDFPEFFERQWRQFNVADFFARVPTCNGPVSYADRSKVEADIANLKASAGNAEVFMTAASPGIIAGYMPNRYYPTNEEYIFALADAMKEEYDTIYEAGIVLQLDCPDLPGAAGDEDLPLEDFRKLVTMRLEAVDYATRDIPPDRMRLHMCWGNGEGPHHTDVPLAHLIDLVLDARPAAVSFEGANPRHEHEWKVFEDVKLPEGKVIMPGVLDSTTNFIEHPELVAQRLVRYAEVVGKTNVIASSDCGFATLADFLTVDPRITWAKLAAMAEGAGLASAYLWGQAG